MVVEGGGRNDVGEGELRSRVNSKGAVCCSTGYEATRILRSLGADEVDYYLLGADGVDRPGCASFARAAAWAACPVSTGRWWAHHPSRRRTWTCGNAVGVHDHVSLVMPSQMACSDSFDRFPPCKLTSWDPVSRAKVRSVLSHGLLQTGHPRPSQIAAVVAYGFPKRQTPFSIDWLAGSRCTESFQRRQVKRIVVVIDFFTHAKDHRLEGGFFFDPRLFLAIQFVKKFL